MKLPVIKEREVVPVRLIPVLTHNEFGPETLSGILANRLRVDGFPANPAFDSVEVVIDGEITCVQSAEIVTRTLKDISVYAYHLNDVGEPVKMLSIEWDDIYHNISALEKLLRRKDEHGDIENLLRSEWQREATNLLPPGTFLWRDDLDALWQYHFSFYLKWSGEHPDLRILNYDAYIRPEERSVYLQGFDAFLANTVQPDLELNQTSSPARNSNLPDRKGLSVPKEQRSKEEDFTRVIKSLFNRLIEEGNIELLRQGNTLAFLKALKTLVQGLDKMGDNVTTYGELVEWVKPSETACIKMHKPRVVKGKESRAHKPYSRTDVSRLLSELRRNHRDIFVRNTKN